MSVTADVPTYINYKQMIRIRFGLSVILSGNHTVMLPNPNQYLTHTPSRTQNYSQNSLWLYRQFFVKTNNRTYFVYTKKIVQMPPITY